MLKIQRQHCLQNSPGYTGCVNNLEYLPGICSSRLHRAAAAPGGRLWVVQQLWERTQLQRWGAGMAMGLEKVLIRHRMLWQYKNLGRHVCHCR